MQKAKVFTAGIVEGSTDDYYLCSTEKLCEKMEQAAIDIEITQRELKQVLGVNVQITAYVVQHITTNSIACTLTFDNSIIKEYDVLSECLYDMSLLMSNHLLKSNPI